MNAEQTSITTVSERIERLQAYDIGVSDVGRVRSLLTPRTEIEKPNRNSIVGEGVLNFMDGLSEQNKRDIQHAYLFATLAANKKYPSSKDGKEWYGIFIKVMIDCGFLPVQHFYDDLHVSEKTFRMEKMVLKVLSSAIAGVAVPGPTSAVMLKVAGETVSSLQTNDEPLKLFERNVRETGTGGFSAASCIQTTGGEVIVAMGTVRYISRETPTKVLFVDWDSSKVSLYKGECHMTKVPSVVEVTRELIIQRLGDRAIQKVMEWDI